MAKQGQALWVTLKARTTKFERGLKRARRRLVKFRNAIPGANLLLNKFTVALSVGGLAVWANSVLTAADGMKKFADRVGLNVGRLAELEHAAERTGVKVASFRMGIQRMTRRVAEAARGTGEARGALKELGVDAQALARMSPDRQFHKLADAMENVANQGDRVRLAMKLFDSEGVALVNTMRGGSKALDGYAASARKLGSVITQRQAENIEAARDAVDDMGKSIQNVMLQAVAKMAPLITSITGDITSWVSESRDGIVSSLLPALENVALVFAGIADTVDGLMFDIKAATGGGPTRGFLRGVNVIRRSRGLPEHEIPGGRYANQARGFFSGLREKEEAFTARQRAAGHSVVGGPRAMDPGFSSAEEDLMRKQLEEAKQSKDIMVKIADGVWERRVRATK